MRKYERGELIRSIDQLMNQDLIWCDRNKKIYHAGWFISWQLQYVQRQIKLGYLYTVKRERVIIMGKPNNIIQGVAPDTPVTENEHGGKQSATPYAFHLLPLSSMFAAAEVAAYGANKYGETLGDRNYIKIATEDHINHCIQHLYAYLAGDTSDDHLGHAIVRAMFAYDVAQRKGEQTGEK